MNAAEQILANWPDCFHAVAWFELHYAPAEDDGPEGSCLDLLIDAKVRPDRALELVRSEIRECIADGDAGKHAEALAETDHPSFLTYLAGRLGAC